MFWVAGLVNSKYILVYSIHSHWTMVGPLAPSSHKKIGEGQRRRHLSASGIIDIREERLCWHVYKLYNALPNTAKRRLCSTAYTYLVSYIFINVYIHLVIIHKLKMSFVSRKNYLTKIKQHHGERTISHTDLISDRESLLKDLRWERLESRLFF